MGAIGKQVSPPLADRTDDAALADLDDLDLMHIVRESHFLRKPDGLAAIAFEDGRTGHGRLAYIPQGYTNFRLQRQGENYFATAARGSLNGLRVRTLMNWPRRSSDIFASCRPGVIWKRCCIPS